MKLNSTGLESSLPEKDGERVRLWARTTSDYSTAFTRIRDAVAALPVDNVVLGGLSVRRSARPDTMHPSFVGGQIGTQEPAEPFLHMVRLQTWAVESDLYLVALVRLVARSTPHINTSH
jgi:hypothetical protein